ncbi:nitrile hydratase subunit beta [Cognatishimia sp. WU-CL00825]|uniref:nitrile hydratase subunit beta n=1 Tax=Cognatishimia sp. WU-CL00825 TaxID=3127658 RepID=UPI0031078701
MTRVHDMGGRFGDGAIDPGDDAIFAKEWHGRALALNLAVGALGKWNIDVSRHARERLSPRDYSQFSYYEKWLAGLTDLMVQYEVVSEAELIAGVGADAPALGSLCLKAEAVASVLASGGPSERPSEIAPVFDVGDLVQTRRPARNQKVEGGHTRLPAYAAGVVGRVALYHGTHVLPDASAHGLGDQPEPLYAVAFPAASVWGVAENPRDEVVLDLWQSYLVPV